MQKVQSLGYTRNVVMALRLRRVPFGSRGWRPSRRNYDLSDHTKFVTEEGHHVVGNFMERPETVSYLPEVLHSLATLSQEGKVSLWILPAKLITFNFQCFHSTGFISIGSIPVPHGVRKIVTQLTVSSLPRHRYLRCPRRIEL